MCTGLCKSLEPPLIFLNEKNVQRFIETCKRACKSVRINVCTYTCKTSVWGRSVILLSSSVSSLDPQE